MKQTSSWLSGFLPALGVVAYTTFVALLMFNVSQWMPKEDTFLAPVTFLLLFVTSAAIVGSLVLGRPIMYYLDGKKKEAVQLFLATVCWLFISFVIVLGYQLLSR